MKRGLWKNKAEEGGMHGYEREMEQGTQEDGKEEMSEVNAEERRESRERKREIRREIGCDEVRIVERGRECEIVRGRVLDMGRVRGKYKNRKSRKYGRTESKM